MARQIPTMAELTQVSDDFETFFLPFDASLDLGSRTAYGTTDPAVDLSMVNIRHLNNTRGFRGTWNASPSDGNEPVPYQTGQVVVGSNNIIYQLTGTSGTSDPTTDSTNWTSLGVQLTVERAVDVTTTGGPGLISTNTNGVITLQMRGYTMGNGVSISTEGEISVTNFSLTDVHTFTTTALRNSARTIEWHTGDVAIVTEGTGTTNIGRGTYVYTGATNGNDYTGTTVDEDWTLLALPGNVVTMLGTRTGVISIANVIQDINDGGSQILTDTEYTANAFKYSGAGTPQTTNPSAAGRTITSGDIYVDTTNDNFYFYSDDAWFQANPATLDDVGDVYLTNPQLDHHLVYSPNAGGTGVPGWHNQTPTQISGRNILIEDLMDVTVTSVAIGDLLQRDATNNAWVNITIDELRAQFGLNNLNDVTIATPTENQIIRYNDTTDMWENVTARTLVGDTTNGVRLEDLQDVTPGQTNSEFLQWNGTNWVPVTLAEAADEATGGLAIENLNNVVNTNLEENDILVYNVAQGGWHPQAPAETAVRQLDDVGDVSAYATQTVSYLEQAVQATTATVTGLQNVTLTFGAAFIDDSVNPQSVFFVPNNGFVSNAGRTSITETTFNNANAVGPFNLVQTVGTPTEYTISFTNANDAATAATDINNITGNAVAVTRQTGPAHPPVGSIIHWVQTNEITGAGEWRYEVLSTHTNTTVDLDDLRDVRYPNPPMANQALVWNGVDNVWEPRTENQFRVREATFDPLTGGNVELLDVTRTVVATRAADTTRPNVTETNGVYSIRTDSTDSRTTREVQAGDLYVAGNRDLYYASIDTTATPNLVFNEILHPASQSGRTIRLDQLPDPSNTDIRQIIRWNPLANNNAGAWEIAQEEEEAISSIFDIADVDHRLIGGNPQYAFPDVNVISGARVQTAVNNGGNVDITFINTATGLGALNVGDRVTFWNEVAAPGDVRQTNGTLGFVIQAINQEVPVMMTLHSPDNMDISMTVAQGLIGLRPITADVTGTMGSEAPVANGDILQYHFEQGHWHNIPISASGAITQVQLGTDTTHVFSASTEGVSVLPDVTINADGIMTREDKIKLDNLPETPDRIDGNDLNNNANNLFTTSTPEQFYALGVNRVGTGLGETGDYSERWFNLSHLVTNNAGNLIWTDDADGNGAQLTNYRETDGTERSIISTTTSGRYLALRFGVFEPTFDAQTSSIAWDQPIDTITADANNPIGVDQFISSVASISLDSGNSQTLTDFTAGAFDNTPAAGQDWQQSFTLTTGNIFDSNTAATGGTTIATFGYNERTGTGPENVYTGTPNTSTHTIRWGNVSAGNPTTTLRTNSYNFYERVQSLTIRQSISGLFDTSNGSITWTRGAGLTGGTLTGTNSLTSTFGISNILYKDNRNLDTDATVTAVVNATRPATITGTQYVQSLNTGTSNRPGLGAPIMPFFRLTIDAVGTTPTAYGSAAPAILTGDFTTGNGMTLNSGITRVTSVSALGGDFNPANDTFFWFGLPSSMTRPTFMLAQPLSIMPNFETPVTVNFDRASMTGSNVPTGWTSVDYTFYGFRVAAGAATITVS